MDAPLPQGRLRPIVLDGEPAWRLQCPGCGHWAYIDEDQLHGRVSIDHTDTDCTFHETRDWYSTALWVP